MIRGRSRSTRRGRLGALAALAIGLAATAVPVGSATAQARSVFEATANAEAVRIGVSFDPPIAQEELANPAALAAQARLTSRGESSGYASSPYPGDFPVTVPGLLSSAILQGAFSVPSYPLIASSSYPSAPEQTVVLGPLDLAARSSADSTAGTASDGGDRSVASVAVDPSSGTVTAQAVSEIAAVDLGDLLSIAGVRSRATARRAPGADVDRDSEFTVSGFRLLGQELEVNRDGLVLAGSEAPLGLGAVSPPLDALLADLTQLGTTVRFLPSEDTEHGVVSAGLEISHTFDAASDVPASTVTVTLGRTAASVDNRLLPTPNLPQSATTGGPLGENSGPGQGASPAGTRPAPTASSGPASGGGPGAASGSGSAVQPVSATGSLGPELVDAARFYPVVVIGGLALVGLSALLRRWGLRSQWTS